MGETRRSRRRRRKGPPSEKLGSRGAKKKRRAKRRRERREKKKKKKERSKEEDSPRASSWTPKAFTVAPVHSIRNHHMLVDAVVLYSLLRELPPKLLEDIRAQVEGFKISASTEGYGKNRLPYLKVSSHDPNSLPYRSRFLGYPSSKYHPDEGGSHCQRW